MDRRETLEALAETLADREAVTRAWVANSFENRLLFVEVAREEGLPTDVRERIEAHGLRGANDAYGIEGGEDSFMGAVGDGDQHCFLDVERKN